MEEENAATIDRWISCAVALPVLLGQDSTLIRRAGRLRIMEVLRPAQRKTYRVEVFEAPTQRDRERGQRPAPVGTFNVDGLTLREAETRARSRLNEDYPDRRPRVFSHNARTAGFVVYYQAGA